MREQTITEKRTRAENFAKILAFCTEFEDALSIANHLKTTTMTSRKYMKILIDSGYVKMKEKSLKFVTMRQIKRSVKKLSDNQLLDLCEKYRVKFARETLNANQALKAKEIADKAALEAIQREGGNSGTVDPKTGARVFLLADTQRWTRQRFGTDKVHASGASLSMVMATASY